MASSTHEPETAIASDLFDKYFLPKVALSAILVASLLGTAVSMRLTGSTAITAILTKWLYLVSAGVLTGGLVWKQAFVSPADFQDDAYRYCRRMYDRFQRISIGALIVLDLSGAVVLGRYYQTLRATILVACLVLCIGVLNALVLWHVASDRSVEQQFRTVFGVTTLGATVSIVGLTAIAEVSLEASGATAMIVRIIHLLAFSVWVGGAVWNIFVAVPTGQENPTIGVIRAAGTQLERFRWAVRFIIPTLFITGGIQAVSALGYRPQTYLAVPVGLAVLAKIGVVGVLVVIFKLCPMWRACSPIDGVCDLTDLQTDDSDEKDSAPTGSDPSDD